MQVRRIAIVSKSAATAADLAAMLEKNLRDLGVPSRTLNLMDPTVNPAQAINDLEGFDGAEIHLGLLETVRRRYDDASDYANEHKLTGAVQKRYIHFWPYGMVFLLTDVPGTMDERTFIVRQGQDVTLVKFGPVPLMVARILRAVDFKGHGICSNCMQEADLVSGVCQICQDKRRRQTG